MEHVIEARSLSKIIAGDDPLANLSFKLKAGEVLGLVGAPSPWRKAAMEVLSVRRPADSGELFILDLEAKTSQTALMGKVGYLPQELGLDEDLSALENLIVKGLSFGMSRRAAKNRALYLMRELKFDENANVLVCELTSSKKKTLAFVASLLSEPKVLVLDDLFEGLSVDDEKRIKSEINRQKRAGQAMVISMSTTKDRMRVLDWTLLLYRGRELGFGRPRDLIEKSVGKEILDLYLTPKELDYYLGRIKDKFKHQVLDGTLRLFLHDTTEATEALEQFADRPKCLRPSEMGDVFLLQASELTMNSRGSLV